MISRMSKMILISISTIDKYKHLINLNRYYDEIPLTCIDSIYKYFIMITLG